MNKNILLTIILIIILIGAAFYWFEYRPSKIRKECWKIAPSSIEGNTEKNYYACLIDHGIKE